MTVRVKLKQIETLPPTNLVAGLVPQVRVIRVPEHTRPESTNTLVNCHAAIRITLQDLPAALLQAKYELQLELGRWCRSKTIRDRNTNTMVKRGSGFKHPSDWTGSATLNPHGLSNRGGRHHMGVPRPTAFDLSGVVVPNGVVELLIGDVLLPWFSIDNAVIDSDGNTTRSLRYNNGRSRRGNPGNAAKGYPGNSYRGFFVFRYSAFNPLTGRREIGPWSDVVCAQPLAWPTRPSGNYPKDMQVSLPAPSLDQNIRFTASMSTTAKSSNL